MSKPKNQCKDCKDRHVGCHSECESYLSYSKSCEERREAIRRSREVTDVLSRYNPDKLKSLNIRHLTKVKGDQHG